MQGFYGLYDFRDQSAGGSLPVISPRTKVPVQELSKTVGLARGPP